MKKLKRKSLKIRKNIKEAALAAITAGSLSVVMELRRGVERIFNKEISDLCA